MGIQTLEAWGLLPSLEHGFKDQKNSKLGIFKLLEKYPSFLENFCDLTTQNKVAQFVQRLDLGKIR